MSIHLSYHALSEGIVNTVIHKDLRLRGGPLFVVGVIFLWKKVNKNGLAKTNGYAKERTKMVTQNKMN